MSPIVPEAASDDSGSEKATVEASEKNMVDDDIVVHKKADGGLEQPDRPRLATPAGQNRKTVEPDESPLVKGPSVDPRSGNKTDTRPLERPAETRTPA